jgi:nucleotide-binding universal stress UspA family protein
LSDPSTPELPFVKSVLHPTDLSEASGRAFAHALGIALVRQTKLTILHVGDKGRKDHPWTDFPGVRETLEQWGLLEQGSPRSAVYDELKIRVKKVSIGSSDPVGAILEFQHDKPSDLIVLATHGRDGVPRWIRGSVSEPVARHSKTMTLFVPQGTDGFVSARDGRFSMTSILVPIDHQPPPDAAIEFATRTAAAIGRDPVAISLLYVGDSSPPELDLGDNPAWSWNRVNRSGDVVEQIVATATEVSANLIVMVTAGHDGILDALRGSTTERVLRHAPCPVLAVPQAWIEKALAGSEN